MKKLLFVIVAFLSISASAQNCEMAKYFDQEIKLPINDYLSLPTGYSFSDTLLNNLLNLNVRPFKRDISVTPRFLSKYRATPFNYSIYPSNEELTYIPKFRAIGSLILTPNCYCFLLRQDEVSFVSIEIWSVSREGVPLSHICVFSADRVTFASEELETPIVQSKITENGEILWDYNERGLHVMQVYKVNNSGKFELVSTKSEGEFEY